MKRVVAIFLAASSVAIAAVVFIYPHVMIAPGKLIPSHQSLTTDCFACHTLFRGVSAERCVVCHNPADIGRLTTKGQPIVTAHPAIAFHQKLIAQDCISCHLDHEGVQRLRPLGGFDHALLRGDIRNRCEGCHTPPTDSLHRQISGNCSQCHTQKRWKPATFDHTKYFKLDRNHNTQCVTCHVNNEYHRYTCYGCHEHTLDNIRKKHIEEGIRDFSNCVKCHRSAKEQDD